MEEKKEKVKLYFAKLLSNPTRFEIKEVNVITQDADDYLQTLEENGKFQLLGGIKINEDDN